MHLLARALWLLLICGGSLLVAGCASEVVPTPTPGPLSEASSGRLPGEPWALALGEDVWYLGGLFAGNDHLVRWYVPQGKPSYGSPEMVNSLYSMQLLSPRQAYEGFVERASFHCPSFVSSILDESAGTLIFEWSRGDDCPRGASAWYEIQRVTATDTGTAYLSYSTRHGALPEEGRVVWLEFLRQTQLDPAVEAEIVAQLAALPPPPGPTAVVEAGMATGVPPVTPDLGQPGALTASTLAAMVYEASSGGAIQYTGLPLDTERRLDDLREIYPPEWLLVPAARPVAARVAVEYAGRSREIEPLRAELIRTWMDTVGQGMMPAAEPYVEMLFLEEGEEFWLAVPGSLAEEIKALATSSGGEAVVELAAVLVGMDGLPSRETEAVFVVLDLLVP